MTSEAKKVRNRAYYAKNREKVLELGRRWREANSEKVKALKKAWNETHPEALRVQKLKKYGITVEQYDVMLAAQGGVCAICKKPEALGGDLAVDHDHATDEVRGLLCRTCNFAIGLLHDSHLLLKSASEYLMPVGSDEHLMGLIMGMV